MQITLQELNMTYPNGKKALQGVSASLDSPSLIGLLGPNGAGKSTLMKLLVAGLLPTGGAIRADGEPLTKCERAYKARLGYLPQDFGLFDELTVEQFLDYMGALKGLRSGRESIRAVIEAVHLGEKRRARIRTLSGGQRQRVGIAQALLGDPAFLIFDEPTVGLDPKQIIEVRELIKELGKKHTVILSSHILTEISAVCDHVFTLSKGKLVASDSTEHLLERMSGAQEIALLVKEKEQRMEELLKELPGVAEVSREPGEAAEEVLFHVTAERGEDIREALFHACAKEEIPVLEMHTETKSLEDVFLELTGADGKGEQA